MGNFDQEYYIKNFEKWIDFSKTMMEWFDSIKDILPSEVIEGYKKINLFSGGKDEIIIDVRRELYDSSFTDTISYLIAQKIIDKSQKRNINDFTNPNIISVSISSMGNEYFCSMLIGAKDFFNIICESLTSKMQEHVDLNVKTIEEKEHIKKSLESLYAVIVDTTHYNWFPDAFGAILPRDFDNHFGIIYNTNLSSQISANNDKHLFDKVVPYCTDINIFIS